MFGVTNYIGNGLCQKLGHVNFVNIASEAYNFEKRRLPVHQGGVGLFFNRNGADQLDCVSHAPNTRYLQKMFAIYERILPLPDFLGKIIFLLTDLKIAQYANDIIVGSFGTDWVDACNMLKFA